MNRIPRRYKVFNGLKEGNAVYTGLFSIFTAKSLTSLFSGYDFWSDITSAILDPYLNTFLADNYLQDALAKYISYDNNTGIYTLEDDAPIEMLAYALAGKFTETEATYQVMTQENLNIVEYIDTDRNVMGAQKTTSNYDKVTIDITNGATQLTDNYAAQTNTVGGGTDTSTQAVAGFNSSDFSNSQRTTDVIAQRSNTNGAHIDTHSTLQSADKNETAAREDTIDYDSYTDVLTHTRHIVLSPDAYFQIQKEMADYNLLVTVREAVAETFCKGVW